MKITYLLNLFLFCSISVIYPMSEEKKSLQRPQTADPRKGRTPIRPPFVPMLGLTSLTAASSATASSAATSAVSDIQVSPHTPGTQRDMPPSPTESIENDGISAPKVPPSSPMAQLAAMSSAQIAEIKMVPLDLSMMNLRIMPLESEHKLNQNDKKIWHRLQLKFLRKNLRTIYALLGLIEAKS